MSTYEQKIRYYEARIRKCQELGIEPRDKDVSGLLYYVSRAEKKGADHETTAKDKIVRSASAVKRGAKWVASDLLEIAGRALAGR